MWCPRALASFPGPPQFFNVAHLGTRLPEHRSFLCFSFSENHFLSWSIEKLEGAYTKLNMYTSVYNLSFIFNFFRDILDRQLQAETSASILSNTTNPVVMLSYITNPPGSRDYRRIVEHGRVKVCTCIISLKTRKLNFWMMSGDSLVQG